MFSCIHKSIEGIIYVNHEEINKYIYFSKAKKTLSSCLYWGLIISEIAQDYMFLRKDIKIKASSIFSKIHLLLIDFYI